MNKNSIITLLGFSIIHGIIDLCCALVVFSALLRNIYSADSAFFYIIAYNIIAFGLQAPLGILVDKFKNPKGSAQFGCLLVLISFLLLNYPFLAVMVTALGNAFFHIGGGSISLNINPAKATAPGIFVAPGAIGLTVGILIGKSVNDIYWPFILLLIGSIIFINVARIPQIKNQTKNIKSEINNYYLVIFLLLFSISIRSLYGIASAWKEDITWLILLAVGISAGKALGGIVADKYGWIRTAIPVLLVSAPLLSFFKNYPLLVIIGAFLLQMTMPITLTALSNMLKGRSATAFGLTALALVVGAIPTYSSGVSVYLNSNWTTLAIILISAIFLLISLKSLSNYFKHQIKINI